MDCDQLVKRWWLEAPRAFRGLLRRPDVILLFTRLPARLTFSDRIGWFHRLSKTACSLLAFATRSAHRVLYIAGRDDMATGFLLRRVRDPAICTAHSADRAALRGQLDLPLDRHLVGILGGINGRKNIPLVAAAVRRAGPDVDLLLAGSPNPEIQAWLDGLSDDERKRVIVRAGFHSNEELDGYVAASDIVAIAHENNGPSGIMGKAVAAGVPVLAAGSKVRARECAALNAGVHTAMTEDGLAAGIRQLLGSEIAVSRKAILPTAEEFAEVILTGSSTKRAAQATC
jgi:glycosyltransferase involved in cell wall biosynthesis